MDGYQSFYRQLNPEQRRAVDTTDGPLLIIAGPGTGKTQLLSVRAASIVASGKAAPENILIVTYTNAGAKAMKERLAKVIGPAGYDVEVGTFHSFANSIIQESVEAANYVGDRILMNEVEQAEAIQYILDHTDGLEEIRPFRAPYTYLKDIQQRIGEMKKDGISPSDLAAYLKDPKAGWSGMEEKYVKRLTALAIVYARYEALKEGREREVFDERGRYDFDDMIIFATGALKAESALLKEYRERYRYVMVDEFQDTNRAQLELLFTLLDYKDPNLCCVGDDDQSIYRFQGASVANFRTICDRYPGIVKISLGDNYRSSKELIEMSGRLLRQIPSSERVGDKALRSIRDYKDKEIVFKELSTEQEELLFIVDKVKELAHKIGRDKSLSDDERAVPYNSIAVLARKRSQIMKVIDAFLQAGIPYATDGKEDISGEARVAQLMDALELAHIDPNDPGSKDVALYRVLSADYFAVPQADILRFIRYVNDIRKKAGDDRSLFEEFLKYFSGNRETIVFEHPERIRSAANTIRVLIDDASVLPVHSVLINFIKNAGIFRFILREYSDNGILRIRQLRGIGSFVNMVKIGDMAKPGLRLTDFMAEMKTRKDNDLPVQGSLVTLTQAGVRVYTAHGSKGMEFHSVIIPFCLQNKSWPMRQIADKIQLPADLFKDRERTRGREEAKRLALLDETRLFYVAMTRAKSNLIFTASPTDDAVVTSYLGRLELPSDKGPSAGPDEESLIGRSISSTDAQDPFIGTGEILRDMIANMTLNPTRLNGYITCRRRFLYNDVLKLPGAKKRSLVFGNCVHKALEETYKRLKKTEKFPPFGFFEEAFRKELRYQGVDKAMERECLNKMKTVKGWYAEASKNPVIPIDLEKKLTITVGDNIIFTGKYDKVEWDDQARKTVRIADYKTGKPDDHLKAIDGCSDLASPECEGYLRQLVAYKLLFEKDKKESKGRRVASGVLVFIEPVQADMARLGYRKGQYASKVVTVTDDMVLELERLIKDVWSGITNLKFEKFKERDKDECGRCDFDAICWR